MPLCMGSRWRRRCKSLAGGSGLWLRGAGNCLRDRRYMAGEKGSYSPVRALVWGEASGLLAGGVVSIRGLSLAVGESARLLTG